MGETFSLAVRKQYSKRVFENEVLRRTSASNRGMKKILQIRTL
jgi:hypothetical protein